MKLLLCLLVLTSFGAQAATPFMTVKDRLRLDMWINGLEEKPVALPKKISQQKPLPEELERALRKN